MGCVASRELRSAGSRGVLVLGLDGAGATTILYQLVLGRRLETIPTLGVNREIIQADGLELQCWDIGGQDKIRPLWRQYSRQADAVIFVVDAADMQRIKLAADELAKLYVSGKKVLQPDRPLLIFANKQDVPNAADADIVERILRVPSLPVETVNIFPCTASDRQSLQKGISWLTAQLKTKAPISVPVSEA